MKNSFFEYYRYTTEQYTDLINNGIIVLDTNVLLDIYRYPKDSRDKMFEVLNRVKDQLWLPFQVANEFYKNRLTVIHEKASSFHKLRENIFEDFASVKKYLNNPSEKKFRVIKYEKNLRMDLIDKFDQFEADVEKIISECVSFTDDLLIGNDTILNKITDIFEGKINSCMLEADLQKIYDEGKKRYKIKIPPGYQDLYVEKKPEPDCYGDLILWKEILEYSKSKNINILLVTGDQKEDWWREVGGKTIGPRPELIKEFFQNNGKLFYAYSAENFIHAISEEYNISNTEQLQKDAGELVKDKQPLEPKCYYCGRIGSRLEKHLRPINTRDGQIVYEAVDTCSVCKLKKRYVSLPKNKRTPVLFKDSKPVTCDNCGTNLTFSGYKTIHGLAGDVYSCPACGALHIVQDTNH